MIEKLKDQFKNNKKNMNKFDLQKREYSFL